MSRGDEDRRAYERRAQDIREEIARGKTIEQVMAGQQMERMRQLREMTDQEERESRERQDRR
jgi:hypothetical protein